MGTEGYSEHATKRHVSDVADELELRLATKESLAALARRVDELELRAATAAALEAERAAREALDARVRSLMVCDGDTMPDAPTQRALSVVVKKIFAALGGSVVSQ